MTNFRCAALLNGVQHEDLRAPSKPNEFANYLKFSAPFSRRFQNLFSLTEAFAYISKFVRTKVIFVSNHANFVSFLWAG